MIKGTYVFYENNKEIARSSNIITKFGKRYFSKLMAGNVPSATKDLAVGIHDSKTISGIASTGSVVTFTTTYEHGLFEGNKVSISNVSPTAYNFLNATISSVPSTTTFTILDSTNSAYVSGGNVSSEVDTRLGFEIYRTPVNLGSTDIQMENGLPVYNIVYKATLPQDLAGVISEIGIYPSTRSSANSFDSKFIADFDNYLDWTDSDGYNPETSETGARVGTNVLVMSSNGTSAKEYTTNTSFDLEGYSNNDSITCAYYKGDNNLSTITVKFYTSTGNYYFVDLPSISGTGKKISQEVLLSSLFGNVVGSPNKSEITKIGIVITPVSGQSTLVGLDAVRINDEDTFDPIYGLVSRSILNSPYLTKTAGRQIDVEYRLEVTF